MNIDDVYSQIGQCGPYQWRMFAVSSLVIGAYAALSTFSQQFACWEPPFDCVHQNGSVLSNRCFDNAAASCATLSFHSSYSTVVTEWGLVCDQAWRPRSAQSAFMLGLTVSSLLSGPLSDRFGRLRLTCLMAAGSLATVVAQALAPNVDVYITARMFNGVLHMGMVLSAFVLQQEMVGPDYRALCGNLAGCIFSAGMMLLAPVAWACASWRHLYAIVVAFGCLVPLLWFYVPESPRWLLVRGHRERALLVLKTIAAGNSRPLTRDLSDLRAPPHLDSESITALVRTRRGLVWTLVLVLAWFAVNLGFYSLTAASTTVGGGRFVNFAISAFVDLPAHLVVYLTLDRIGRRRSLSLSFVGGTVGCLGVLALPASSDHSRLGGRTAFLWFGKMMMAATFTVVYVHTLEIFPTSVRNRGISFVNVTARLSGILYPFMVVLDSVTADLQYVLLAALLLVSGGLALLLPETAGRPLCATVAQLVGREAHTTALHSLLRSETEAEPLMASFSDDGAALDGLEHSPPSDESADEWAGSGGSGRAEEHPTARWYTDSPPLVA